MSAHKAKSQPSTPTPQKVGGAAYRRAAGKIGITLSVTAAQRDLFREAAARRKCRSMSAYFLSLALADAEKILGKK